MTGMIQGTSLFSLGSFVLPSKRTTHFKIECDTLTAEDWKALARLAVAIMPPFGEVEGVPRGGIPFADALREYVTPGVDLLLIADDVWVTGLSMNKWRDGRAARGIVAFTRNVVDPWVKPLFIMHGHAEEASYKLDRDPGVLEVGN